MASEDTAAPGAPHVAQSIVVWNPVVQQGCALHTRQVKVCPVLQVNPSAKGHSAVNVTLHKLAQDLHISALPCSWTALLLESLLSVVTPPRLTYPA